MRRESDKGILVDGSTNVHLAEYREDGSWVVQFKERIDPRSLTVRAIGTERPVQILTRTPRQATIRFDGATPIAQILSREPIQVIFECIETNPKA
jgi:hypothetical protein